MAGGIGLYAWWDEPAYKPCNTLHLRGLFIFRKLAAIIYLPLFFALGSFA
jgi:hypothetical protein